MRVVKEASGTWRCVGIIGMLALVCAVASADFKWVPADEEFVKFDPMSVGMRNVYDSPDVEFDKVPKGALIPHTCGTLMLGKGRTLDFFAYASSGTTPDTIIFDTNGDKDLTNDEKITGFKPNEPKTVTLEVAGGHKLPANVWLDVDNVSVQLLEWLKGTVDLDGRETMAVLIDHNGVGLDLSSSDDVLLLDLNGNGKFDGSFQLFGITEGVFLRDPVLIGKKLYSVKLGEDPPDVTLTPYSGAQGKLVLAVKPKGVTKSLSLSCAMEDAKGNSWASWLSPEDFPMLFPAPNDIKISGMLVLYAESGESSDDRMVCFSLDKPVHIDADKTTTLTIGEHEAITIKLSQDAMVDEETGQEFRDLTIGCCLRSNDGIEYTNINALPEHAIMEQFPRVRILNENGRELEKGDMEPIEFAEGESSCGAYIWGIPETIKTGDRVTVEVTWDTGIAFGVLEAKTDYVIRSIPAKPIEMMEDTECDEDMEYEEYGDLEIEEPE